MDKKDYIRFLVCMREFNDIEPVKSLYIKKKLEKQKNLNRGLAPLRGAKPLRTPLVEFVAYNLLPNHNHFILKQLVDGGISEFMKRLSGGYTCYFNQKYNRTGSLFEGTFKAVLINSNEYLLYLSAYINGNSEIHKIIIARNWPWSSYKDYFGFRSGTLCNKKVITEQFKNIYEYKDLVNIIVKESQERKEEIKKYLLE